MTDLVAKFTLKLDDQLTAGSRRSLSLFRRSVDEVASAAGRLNIGARAVAAGNLISTGVTKAVGGLADVVDESWKSAAQFQKSLVDIQKVAKGADDSAEGIARISLGLKEASKDLGVLPDQVAELAAQITPVFSGKEDIVALTSDVAKIGTAWDITGQQAGKFFADTARGMRLTATQTKDLFGGINELSNQLGIKAADIADAFTRSAGVIQASGLSARTGAALNATLIAAGASSEVAATGVRTFLSRLQAGSAATDQQKAAFKALGLDALKVGANMAKGGTVAEAEIMKVVKAISALPKERQLPSLIQLFGSESIGSIGAAATATESLAQAFQVVGKEGADFTSVISEYNRVSNTTAARVDKLKANIAVLGIQFGEALLPHIDQLVEFLTSPEGQKWGADAVARATQAVTTLAAAGKVLVPIAVDLVSRIADLVETIGGTGTVAMLAAPKIIGLAASFGGPAGLGTAVFMASAALGAFATSKAIDWVGNFNSELEAANDNLADVATSLSNGMKPLDEWTRKMLQQAESTDESRRQFARLMLQLQGGDVAAFDKRENASRAEREQFAQTKKAAETRDAEWQARLAQKQSEAQAANAAAQAPQAAQAMPERVRQRADSLRRATSARPPDQAAGGSAGVQSRPGKGSLDINVYDKRVAAVLREDGEMPVAMRLPRGSAM